MPDPIDTFDIVLFALLAISEALSLIPGFKANGVFQAIYFFLKSFQRK